MFFPEALNSRRKSTFSPRIPSSSSIYPSGPEIVIALAPSCSSLLAVPQVTLPKPEITTFLPASFSLLASIIAFAKYTIPYPVASDLPFNPPQVKPLPVRTPSNLLTILLYCPYRYPISLAPTPRSPAGTSHSGPICLYNSVMKAWQNLITSASDLPLGSKSAPPLPPPSGSPVNAFLKICSNPRNLMIPGYTLGANLKPPL